MVRKIVYIRFFYSILMLFFLASCSVVKTMNNPSYKDLSILQKGADRSAIIAELGAPIATIEEDGAQVDIFKIKQGSHGVTKAAKGVGYTLAGIATFGLSEIVLWPTETVAGAGAEVQLKAVYDDGHHLDHVKVLKDDRWLKLSDIAAQNDDIKNSE